MIVLAGRPTLRTPQGVRELEEGKRPLPAREEGAHKILNRTEEPVRFLALSNVGGPDVVVRLDSGLVGLIDRQPGDAAGLRLYFERADAVDYWEGEIYVTLRCRTGSSRGGATRPVPSRASRNHPRSRASRCPRPRG